jgi:hypothetical protein
MQVWAAGGRWAKRLTILRASEAVMSAAAVSRVLTEKEGRWGGDSGDKQSQVGDEAHIWRRTQLS